MLLAAAPGTEVVIRTAGVQAQEALDAAAALIERHFDEEPM